MTSLADPTDIWATDAPLHHDPMPGEYTTELGFAYRLVNAYGKRIRYVSQWRRWYVWDGQRWVPDQIGRVPLWAKTIARRVMLDAENIPDETTKKAVIRACRRAESASGIAGILTLASTEPEIALRFEDLDDDPWLLNCQNGTLNLRTGLLGPHDPADHITKITGARFDLNAEGAEFDRFLADIQPTLDMREYLGRVLGHALVGLVREHVLPIFNGNGANGKSTLVTAVQAALGDYAGTADPALFIDHGFESHPTGVADLFGRRLVSMPESDDGRHMAEATVKRLTGGDLVKARRMREDFWEFRPTHTVVMLTNHPPIPRGTDEALWRRLRLVPFDVRIPAESRRGDLGEHLGAR